MNKQRIPYEGVLKSGDVLVSLSYSAFISDEEGWCPCGNRLLEVIPCSQEESLKHAASWARHRCTWGELDEDAVRSAP
jgi:hypothetical protein